MGASLSGAAGQDSSTFQMRGLTETLPQMLALLADVVRNPDVPAGRARPDEGQHRAAAAGADGVAAVRQQQAVPADAVRRASLRAHRRDARDAAGDRSRRRSSSFHRPTTVRTTRSWSWSATWRADAVFAAAEQAFGSWERRALPERKPAALPALKGRTLVFVQRPNSVQSSISVGNFTPAA